MTKMNQVNYGDEIINGETKSEIRKEVHLVWKLSCLAGLISGSNRPVSQKQIKLTVRIAFILY